MIGANNGELTRTTEDTLGPIVETVRRTALDLLASLPEHPTRLRIQAAGVTVDLDWRSSPAVTAAPPALHNEQTGQRAAAVASDDQREQGTGERQLNSHVVCAPAVGTFYHAPEPGKPPFVEQGALVEVGQQVGIIEAMKLMLPVEADRAGRVVNILVPDGQAVQYGDQLIELDPVDSG